MLVFHCADEMKIVLKAFFIQYKQMYYFISARKNIIQDTLTFSVRCC